MAPLLEPFPEAVLHDYMTTIEDLEDERFREEGKPIPKRELTRNIKKELEENRRKDAEKTNSAKKRERKELIKTNREKYGKK